MSTYDISSNMTAEDVSIDRNMRYHWLETAKWARLIAIISFVMLGIGVIALVGMASLAGAMPSVLSEEPGMEALFGGPFITIMVVLGIIGTIIGVYINLRHFQFATRLKLALDTNNQPAFDQAWNDLRMVFRIYGIITIAYIVLYIGAIAFFGSMMMRMFAPGAEL